MQGCEFEFSRVRDNFPNNSIMIDRTRRFDALRSLPPEQNSRAHLQSIGLFRLRVRTSCPTDFAVLVHQENICDVLIRNTQVVTDVTEILSVNMQEG